MIDEFNDHGFTDTSVTRKVALINDTIWDICSREPWPFLEKKLTLTFDGINAVPSNLPSDFRAAVSLIRTDTGAALDPQRYDVMKRKYGTLLNQVGDPLAYYFLRGQLNVYYIPGSGTTLDLEYLAFHAKLTSSSVETDILLPAQHHRAVVLGTLYKLYDMDDDFDIGASFQAQFEDRVVKMRNELWTQQYDRPDRIYAIDDFDLQFLG
jgi:hypothetical protein